VCGTLAELGKASPRQEVDRSSLSAVRYPVANEVEGGGSHYAPGRAPRVGPRREMFGQLLLRPQAHQQGPNGGVRRGKIE
jgi:hypothetical protein